MMRFRDLIAAQRLQFLVFLGLSAGTVALTVVAYCSNPRQFERFLGKVNPLAAITVIAVLGVGVLSILLARGWFAVWIPGASRRFIWIVALAGLMALVMILVDIKVVFREDLNVLFPHSLAYYPVIDYAVQVLFHLAPLSLLLLLATAVSRGPARSAVIWLCFLLVASLEPLLQSTFFVGIYPAWSAAYVTLHVFVFNIIELAIFKRYDLFSMYSFRLAYYFAWHIIWGYIRLRVLF
jgi:hypothetical protein